MTSRKHNEVLVVLVLREVSNVEIDLNDYIEVPEQSGDVCLGCAFEGTNPIPCHHPNRNEVIGCAVKGIIFVKKEQVTANNTEHNVTSKPKHSHYFKNVSHLEWVDAYRVADLFGVTDPCIQHALKKLLVTGNRGYKDVATDVQDVIDTLERWKEMQLENQEENNFDA